MEFICVLSVGGSLASYQVRKEGDTAYSAELRTNNGQRDDLPARLTLRRKGAEWQAQPWHEEIVSGISHAIEMNP
jgi:hypothetical protein